MTLSEQIAAYACGTTLETGEDATVAEVQTRVLDYISVSSAAGRYLDYAPVITAAANVLSGRGAQDECPYPPGIAAFYNAAFAHALDYDDGHLWAGVHASGPVTGTAFALIPQCNPTGFRLLQAIAAGYEIEYRLAKALGKSHIQKGFHGSCTCGVFGAAVTAGMLLGLDTEQLAFALGLAGLACFGSRQPLAEGQMAKPVQVGYAAERGVTSALLAREGFTAPLQIFEGKTGILPILSDIPKDEIVAACLDGLGETRLVNDTYTKLYPCARYTHTAIEACFELRPLVSDLADIQAIEVNTFDIAYEATAPNQNPRNAAEARFSMHYLVAVALRHGFVGLGDFTDQAVARTELRDLGKKVCCRATREWNELYPDIRGAEVRIIMRSGDVYAHKTTSLAGMPGDGDAVRRKFRNACADIYDQDAMRRIESCVGTLHAMPETKSMLAMLRP